MEVAPEFGTARSPTAESVAAAAAEANHQVGELPTEIKDAIVSACHEVAQGQFDSQFVVDAIQGGDGRLCKTKPVKENPSGY